MKPQNVIHLLMGIVCFALSPQSQAANTPNTPDPGPLPISNTADGEFALVGVTGTYNSAFGIYALLSNGAANFNTGVGADVLLSNTANENTAVGTATLLSNTTGPKNTGCGAFALFTNTTGDELTAIGDRALFSNTTGGGNVAIGVGALTSNTIGSLNTANGNYALSSNTEGHDNTAIGYFALLFNTTGIGNTANGNNALAQNTTANDNTAIGHDALNLNTEGEGNTANGVNALSSNTTGGTNTAIGNGALISNTEGNDNTAIGHSAGFAVSTADNVIAIGSNVPGDNVSDTTWIGNVFGVTTQSGITAPVIVSDTGQLGTLVSSERFKKDINTMDRSSEVILSLRPVTFHYKTDTKGTPQFGLIAEEVAKVNPALVLPDKEGKPYTVRYDAVNAMLLNEFLKEHRKNEEQGRDIQEQKATIALQQKQIDALTAGLQKVSAQIEASKPAPQVVNNP